MGPTPARSASGNVESPCTTQEASAAASVRRSDVPSMVRQGTSVPMPTGLWCLLRCAIRRNASSTERMSSAWQPTTAWSLTSAGGMPCIGGMVAGCCAPSLSRKLHLLRGRPSLHCLRGPSSRCRAYPFGLEVIRTSSTWTRVQGVSGIEHPDAPMVRRRDVLRMARLDRRSTRSFDRF